MRRVLRASALVVVLVLATGCAEDGGPTPGGGSTSWSLPPRTTTPPPVTYTPPPVTYTPPCTAEHSVRLEVTTNKREEVPYLDLITACSDPLRTELLLVNDSDVAWTIVTPKGGAHVEQLTHSPAAVLFRDTVATVYRHAILAPESSVVVSAPPSQVTWNIQPAWSVAWLVQEQLTELVTKAGTDQATELVARRSPRRAAVLTCAVGAYTVWSQSLEALGSADRVERLLGALGVGSNTTACASAWRRADDVLQPRFADTPLWHRDVAALARTDDFLQLADTRLSFIHRVWKAAAILSPRIP